MVVQFDLLELSHFFDQCNIPLLVKDNVYPRDIEGIVNDANILYNSQNMRTANMGRGDQTWNNQSFRGDRICWITPDLCGQLDLKNINNYMRNTIKSFQAFKSFQKLQQELQLNGCYSAQFAVYSDVGSHYVRHLDAFKPLQIASEVEEQSTHLFGAESNSNEVPARNSSRKITLILYLNAFWEGGHLRVYLPSLSYDNNNYMDIEPKLGRLVIFRSDRVEHEVLPSYSTRMAITLWAMGYSPPATPLISPSSPRLFDYNSMARYHATNTMSLDHQLLHEVDGQPPPLLTPEYPVDWNEITIFISIASYRDSELPLTLQQLFATARFPSRLSIGLVWQGNLPEDDHTLPFYQPSGSSDNSSNSNNDNNKFPEWRHQVRMISLSAEEAAGPCWARHLSQSLWRGESMWLQLDSHMRFRAGWDAYLLWAWQHCRSSSSSTGGEALSHPVLTTYPLSYRRGCPLPLDTRPTILRATRFDQDNMLRQSARVFPKKTPFEFTRTGLWAAGFSFSSAQLLVDVPYDPLLQDLFFGEEISMAARMFTRGYDCLAPPETVLYHLWDRSHRPAAAAASRTNSNCESSSSSSSINSLVSCRDTNKSANTETVATKIDRRTKNRIFSQDRLCGLLGIMTSTNTTNTNINNTIDSVSDNSIAVGGKYGLGTLRNLQEFEEIIGVNFQKKVVLTTFLDSLNVDKYNDIIGEDDNIDVARLLPLKISQSNICKALTLVESFLK